MNRFFMLHNPTMNEMKLLEMGKLTKIDSIGHEWLGTNQKQNGRERAYRSSEVVQNGEIVGMVGQPF